MEGYLQVFGDYAAFDDFLSHFEYWLITPFYKKQDKKCLTIKQNYPKIPALLLKTINI